MAIMFCAIAAFGIAGMVTAFHMLNVLTGRGLHGDDLIVPFVMTLMFNGAIAGLLIWQLARMITAYQKSGRNVVVEKHYIREAPPAQLGAPTRFNRPSSRLASSSTRRGRWPANTNDPSKWRPHVLPDLRIRVHTENQLLQAMRRDFNPFGQTARDTTAHSEDHGLVFRDSRFRSI
jgi:hypothetical protein